MVCCNRPLSENVSHAWDTSTLSTLGKENPVNGAYRRVWPYGVALALLFTLTPATPTWAQTVEGAVVDDESGAPMGTVEVAVLNDDDQVVQLYVTDENGWFVARIPDIGSYRLRATRIGYEPSTSDAFALESGQAAMAELRLQLDPVLLDPLDAIVERESIALARVGFYDREEMGFAQVRTPEYFEARPPFDISDVFQGMTGVMVVRPQMGYDYDLFSTRRRGCRPSISIDGRTVQDGALELSVQSLLPDDPSRAPTGPLDQIVGDADLERSGWQSMISVTEIAAVEVYPGAGGLPDWVGGLRSPCGAVIIWTKGFVMRAEPGQ